MPIFFNEIEWLKSTNGENRVTYFMLRLNETQYARIKGTLNLDKLGCVETDKIEAYYCPACNEHYNGAPRSSIFILNEELPAILPNIPPAIGYCFIRCTKCGYHLHTGRIQRDSNPFPALEFASPYKSGLGKLLKMVGVKK